jgi:hypothetical protein
MRGFLLLLDPQHTTAMSRCLFPPGSSLPLPYTNGHNGALILTLKLINTYLQRIRKIDGGALQWCLKLLNLQVLVLIQLTISEKLSTTTLGFTYENPALLF